VVSPWLNRGVNAFILFLFFNVFAATLGSADIENGFYASPSDPKNIKISVIDSAQADSLFKKLASNKKISFKYPVEGCYARATQMGEIADLDGIQTGRVYAEGILNVKTDSAKYPNVSWPWHVAPVAYVKQANGFNQLMVFDPTIFQKPVTVAEWVVKMSADGEPKARIDKIYYGSRFQYYYRKFEVSRTSWNKHVLKAAKETSEKYLPLQDLTTSTSSKSETERGVQ